MGLTAKVDFEFTMVTLRCISCGVPYGLADYFQQSRREDHATWYCPNGHCSHYPQDNAEEKLRKELEQANRLKEAALRQATMESQQRKKVERKLDRLNKGVCGSCNRSFKNLERHMQTQHGTKVNEAPKGTRLRCER